MTAAPFFQHVRQFARGAVAEFARESWLVRAERCRMAAEAALPDTSVELYFNLGPTGRHISGRRPRATLPHRAAWVVGPRAQPLYIEKETRDCDIVAIRLVPWFAHRVLGVPAIELRERMVDLDEFWGSLVEDTRERLDVTADARERLAIVERAVARRVVRGGWSDESALVRQLCHAVETGPSLTIGALAARFGLTHRRTIEIFDRTVGLKPKAFYRVRRLRRVFQMSDASPRLSWTTIAHRCGYYDQAHLINDFRQLTGILPSEYVATRSSVGHGFIPHWLAENHESRGKSRGQKSRGQSC
jgi:AraC-like DNA-binding protein